MYTRRGYASEGPDSEMLDTVLPVWALAHKTLDGVLPMRALKHNTLGGVLPVRDPARKTLDGVLPLSASKRCKTIVLVEGTLRPRVQL